MLLLARKKTVFRGKIKQLLLNAGLISSMAVYSVTILFKLSNLLQFISTFMISLPFIPWFAADLNISLRELIWDIIGI